LERPAETITNLQGKVIPSLRDYLKKIDGKLTLDRTYIRKKLRYNNIAIMDIVRNLGFTAIQEHRENCVQLFLGVMYFSEICSIDGTSIRAGMTTGHNNNEEYVITLKKAIQHRPNSRSWELWTRAKTSITSDGTALNEPLGDWTAYHSKSGQWNAYQHNRLVYQSSVQDGVRKWKQYKRQGSLIMAQDTIEEKDFNPSEGIPISIQTYPGRLTTRSLPCKVLEESMVPQNAGTASSNHNRLGYGHC
jgi:hypothetical protein